jgi:hypothetical protein
MSTPKENVDPLADYRTFLVAAEQKSQEDFDKTVLALSGGALGISFTFLKDVIGTNPIFHPNLLLLSWFAWAFSTFAVLASYYLSHLALRVAIAQVDKGTIYKQRPGGGLALWTAGLNAAGAILFLLGVCCITLFVSANLSAKGTANGNLQTTTPSNTAAASANPASVATPASTVGGNAR